MRPSAGVAGAALAITLFSVSSEAAVGAVSTDSGVSPVTLGQYEQELARVDQQLKALVEHPDDATVLRSSIPDEWQVQTPSETFDVATDDLKFKLLRYANHADQRAEVLPEMELKIETQIEAAKEFERAADTSASAKLENILRAREYRNVARTQSFREKLKDIALAWLIRLLKKAFGAATLHPRVSQALLWSLIGSVTLGFIVWLYVLLRHPARDEYAYPGDGGAAAPSYKHWQVWLRDARAAAERGDWREAVHLAYWSGISYLESSGAWKPDRARTPREYLRMLPDVSGRREPLAALTKRFEGTWYAQQLASPEDFAFSLAQLEKIGCR